MSARLVRAAFEALEPRKLLSTTTLINGYGDGSLSVDVDPYGAFGIDVVGKPLQYGDRRPGNLGEVSKSFVYFSPSRQFLTEGSEPSTTVTGTATGITPGYTSKLDKISFTQTSSRSAVSSFVLSGRDINGTDFSYRITLTQTLAEVGPTEAARYGTVTGGFLLQSQLVQTYSITNLLTTSSTFSVVRYLQLRDNTLSGGPDLTGSNLSSDGGRTLTVGGVYEGNFAQMRSFGGSFVTESIQTPNFDSRIIASNGIPSDLYGVVGNTGNGLAKLPMPTEDDPNETTYALYSGLAQQYNYSVGGLETVEFTTTTTLGQNITAALYNALIDEYAVDDPETVDIDERALYLQNQVSIPGNFAFEASIYNVTTPVTGSTTLNLVITRLDGSSGAASVLLTPLFGADGLLDSSAVSLTSPTTYNFTDGQTSLSIPITISSTAAIEQTSFQISVSSTTTGVGATLPSVATVNVRPGLATFRVDSDTPTSVSAGGGFATYTIERSGNTVNTASVTLSLSGTAVAGVDYTNSILLNDGTALSGGVLTFAPGERSKVVKVPLLKGTEDLSTRTLILNLSSAAGNVPVATYTLSYRSVDAGSPRVTNIATTTGRGGITSILLTFSEALAGPGNLSAYSLFLRTGEGAGGTARLKSLPINGIFYNATTHTVTVTPRGALAFNKAFQITVRPDASLTDTSGNMLNQQDGVAGSVATYTRIFSVGNKVSYIDRDGDSVQLSMKGGSFMLVRQTSGEAASVTLFGAGAGTSLFSGTVRSRVKGKAPGTTIGELIGASTATVSLPSQFVVTAV